MIAWIYYNVENIKIYIKMEYFRSNEISDFSSSSMISQVIAGQISSEIDTVRFHFSRFHPPIRSQSFPMVEKRSSLLWYL